MAISYGPSVYTTGLSLWLDPSNKKSYPGSGTNIYDLSGRNNHGTFDGATTITNGYINFEGSTQITTTTQFNNPQTFSIIVFFNVTSLTGKKIFGFENLQTGTSSSWDRHLIVGTDGVLYFGEYDIGWTVFNYTTVDTSSWYCAAVTLGAGNLSNYLNGQLISAAPSIVPVSYSGYWRIGGFKASSWPNATDGYLTGNVGTVMLYDTALTADQIAQNFNAYRGRYGI